MRNIRFLVTSVLVGAIFLFLIYAIASSNRSVKYYILQNDELKERKNIFFLKVHKCASSTIQNILMRFGFSHTLDFVLPKSNNYIGNPDLFVPQLIPLNLRTSNGKYNIFTHHTKYNYESMKKVMYSDAAFISILRDPADLYESLYSYYNLESITKMSLKKILNKEFNETILNKRIMDRIGLNQMAWDFGYNIKNKTRIKIKKFIQKIDKEFHLVMISEYLEASLVLLCQLMNWPLKNVAHLKLNARSNGVKTQLDVDEREILYHLNSIDTEIYDYFLHKFRNKVIEYGTDKMVMDVKELLRLNSQLWKDCVDRSKKGNKIMDYHIRNTISWTCYYSTKDELTFTDEIRQDQITRFTAVKKLEIFLSNKS